MVGPLRQRTFTYFVRGSITELLTSCLTGLFMFNSQHIYSFGPNPNQSNKRSPYSDTSPYEVNECSLIEVTAAETTF